MGRTGARRAQRDLMVVGLLRVKHGGERAGPQLSMRPTGSDVWGGFTCRDLPKSGAQHDSVAVRRRWRAGTRAHNRPTVSCRVPNWRHGRAAALPPRTSDADAVAGRPWCFTRVAGLPVHRTGHGPGVGLEGVANCLRVSCSAPGAPPSRSSNYGKSRDLEHTFRFAKQTLGWTTPKLRSPEAADRWTCILIVAHTQLRLVRPRSSYGHPRFLRSVGRRTHGSSRR